MCWLREPKKFAADGSGVLSIPVQDGGKGGLCGTKGCDIKRSPFKIRAKEPEGPPVAGYVAVFKQQRSRRTLLMQVLERCGRDLFHSAGLLKEVEWTRSGLLRRRLPFLGHDKRGVPACAIESRTPPPAWKARRRGRAGGR